MSELAFPIAKKKDEFWRFADFNSFSEKNIEKYLNKKNGIRVLKNSTLNDESFGEKTFEKIELDSEIKDLEIIAEKIFFVDANVKKSFSQKVFNAEIKENLKAQIYVSNTVLDESFFQLESEIVLKKNSELKFTIISDGEKNSLIYKKVNFVLEENSKLELFVVEIGDAKSRVEFSVKVLGKNADAKINAIVSCANESFKDLRSSQIHNCESSQSNLDLKCVLKDSAKCVFTGLVNVSKDSSDTKANQSCGCLLMSEKATICASPILEIECMDVECAHGCAVSMPEKEQIFYMRSRGLSEEQAKDLIAEGFASFEKALP